jgi:lysine 2,3-aminomutase
MPMRIGRKTARLLASCVVPGRRAVEVVTHVQSPYEVTPELVACVHLLRVEGIPVYNQQVLTLEASRRFQVAATRTALRKAGIDPYYTFYAKGKDEHRESLVPIARALQERKEEARLLPGVFRTDEPVFNVPGLGKSHLRASRDRELIAIRPDGRRVYVFHPWEKGILPVAPWTYVDVSLQDYLERLEALGEDPEEYASIWYYY